MRPRLRLTLFAWLALASPLHAACPSQTNYTVSKPDPAGHPNDTVVTDNETGLVWKQCSEGLTSSNPTAGGVCDQGSIASITWPGAILRGIDSTYAGYTDWRSPNLIELHSLIDLGCAQPAINTAFFPNTGNVQYWSSTSYVPNVLTGWFVNFGTGQQLNTGKTVGAAVRLVRGGQGLDAFAANTPVVTGVSPDAGPQAGGTLAGGSAGTITLSGLLFTGASKVTFGVTDAAAFSVVNDTTISVAPPPAQAPGMVDIRVTNSNGVSATGTASQYICIAAPAVTGITPNVGAAAGGTRVVIDGTGFTSGASVQFGASAATDVSVVSATQLTATAPAHADGTVDVRVTTAGGSSAASAAGQFTYFTAALTVDSLADGLPAAPLNCAVGHAGSCRLRDAISAAQPGETIRFAIDGTIVLADATLLLERNVYIDASGRIVALDGNDSVTVFKVAAGVAARIAQLTIRHGNASQPCAAGQRCGGGIYNAGELTLAGVTLALNSAEHAGAGIFSQGTLRLVNSTLWRNRAAGGEGGGIFGAGAVRIDNSTLWENTAAAGSGLRNTGAAADLRLANSIVGGSFIGPVCVGASTDEGGNLDRDGSCGLSTANGSLPAALIALGPLQDNGGATPTLLPVPGSLAIDFGRDDVCADNTGVNGIDQRGQPRPRGSHCDAGSTEVNLYTLTVSVTTSNGTVVSADGSISACASGQGDCAAAYSAEGEGTPLLATLTAQPAAHYHLAAWGGDCAADGTVRMNADKTCTAAFAINTHAVSGSVTGLAGSGLELRLNGTDAQIVAAADPLFAFAPLPDLSTWAVTVSAQPVSPWQTCVADPATASGTLDGADVSDVAVHCTTNAYAIGGSVSGLQMGSSNLLLQLSAAGVQTASVAPGQASFAFATPVASGTAYAVSVSKQPQGHTCTITAGASGSVQDGNITDVRVACLRLPQLALGIDSGSGYAPYASVAEYLVTLANTGGTADSVAVNATLSAAFDAAGASWICDAGTSGATCAASGSGPLSDTVRLPSDSSLTFLLSAPLRLFTPETTAVVQVSASGALSVADVDTLVIFRDGFDPR